MATATVSRGSRAFVATGVAFLVAWQAAVVAGLGRSAALALGLYGFVFHVVFGKAYALVPSYFARELAFPRAPFVHLPLAAAGAACRFAGEAGLASPTVAFAGAVLWLAGALVFVGALGWTVRDNLSGRETGTGAVDEHRLTVDRVANAAVPVVLAYLLAGAALPVLDGVGLAPAVLPANGPPASHLLAAGAGALLLFAVGFRLLPRFLVADPRPALVYAVLPAGAAAPALLAGDFLGGLPFRLGAALQASAVVGFAAAYADLYRRSERRRVGFPAVLAAVGFGVVAVALGLWFAFVGVDAAALDAHYRLAVGGFLALSIVGVSYQFYPPSVATRRGVDDRTAAASVGLFASGIALEAGGLLVDAPAAAALGRWLALAGAAVYAAILAVLFVERPV
ncbi:hypothetical protein [Salinilacihabitans rarus]|uniref:hypothetical protein n=1 Tax=Salinilacihabitans rarus TaxID=2961596 RepID=UPI0020C934B5|nr:hypothetical protein [Salinilacihabitans rarus]